MIKGGSSQLYTQLKAVVKLKPEKEKNSGQKGIIEFNNCFSCVYNCIDQSCLYIFLGSSNI